MAMQVAGELRRRLEAALAPALLEIEDESALHAGHAGARPTGETHFRALIVSGAFEGRSRLDRQRLVYAAAGDLLAERIHAFSVVARTPEEAARAANAPL